MPPHHRVGTTEEEAATETVSKLREHNLTIPVVILPPELLSDIFLRTIDRDVLGLGNHYEVIRRPRKSRRAITAVCSCWRDVAFNTAALWNSIGFSYQFRLPSNSITGTTHAIKQSNIDFLQSEFDAAGSAPIFLTAQIQLLGTGRDDPSDSRSIAAEVSKSLGPVFPRCESLFMSAPAGVALGLISDDQVHLTNLKKLSMAAHGHLSVSILTIRPARSKIIDLSQSLLLEEVIIWLYSPSVIDDYSTQEIGLLLPDTSSLRRVILTGHLHSRMTFSAIISTPKLSSLSWMGPISNLPQIPPYAKFSLPHLRHLKLGGTAPGSVLSALDAPELLTLTIPSPNPSEALEVSRDRFPLLRVLNATNKEISPSIPPDIVASFSQSHPFLEVLILSANLRGAFASKVASATSLHHLRLVGVVGDGPRWNDPPELLTKWAARFDNGEFPALSHRVFFVHGPYELDIPSAEAWGGYERECLTSLGNLSPFACINWDRFPFWHYFDEEWDDFFARVEADPFYVPDGHTPMHYPMPI